MADTLLGNINSNYYRSRNVLTGEDNTVKVLVEDELDVPFWKDILGNLVPNKRFSISPYTYNVDGNVENLTKGKAEIIKKAGNGDFSTCYIGCVDSDYDYLLKEYSEDGKIIAECPYLLQTYVYSIENYMCQAETLSFLCSKACKVDVDFDFKSFVTEVSKILYPLLIWGLYLHKEDKTDFTAKQWGDIFPNDICIFKDGISDIDILTSLECNVRRKIAELEGLYPYFNHNEFKEYIVRVCPDMDDENCYLFVRGHDIYDFMLNTTIKPVFYKARREHINNIKNSLYASGKEKGDAISHYNNNLVDIGKLLEINYDYKKYSCYYQRIRNDVEMLYN